MRQQPCWFSATETISISWEACGNPCKISVDFDTNRLVCFLLHCYRCCQEKKIIFIVFYSGKLAFFYSIDALSILGTMSRFFFFKEIRSRPQGDSSFSSARFITKVCLCVTFLKNNVMKFKNCLHSSAYAHAREPFVSHQRAQVRTTSMTTLHNVYWTSIL